MNEKELISSKQGKITLTLCLVWIAIGIFAFIAFWSMETSSGMYAERIENGEWDYVLTSMVPYFAALTILPALVIAGIVYFAFSKCSLTVTNKRVYGKSTFGKRVDLPIDSITAVGSGILNSLTIASSSGSLSFCDIKNRDEMHKIVSDLVMKRQTKAAGAPLSSADELSKYKDLLDKGVLTQEEFDAKKKELLGL